MFESDFRRPSMGKAIAAPRPRWLEPVQVTVESSDEERVHFLARSERGTVGPAWSKIEAIDHFYPQIRPVVGRDLPYRLFCMDDFGHGAESREVADRRISRWNPVQEGVLDVFCRWRVVCATGDVVRLDFESDSYEGGALVRPSEEAFSINFKEEHRVPVVQMSFSALEFAEHNASQAWDRLVLKWISGEEKWAAWWRRCRVQALSYSQSRAAAVERDSRRLLENYAPVFKRAYVPEVIKSPVRARTKLSTGRRFVPQPRMVAARSQ
jgi:hypothetical protein